MSEIANRYRRVAAAFTGRVMSVPDDAWDNPSPCEGWVARDIVRHLVEWVPAFLHSGTGLALPAGPGVDDDPAGAWKTLNDALQSMLDDREIAARQFSHERAGTMPVEEAIGQFILGDVLVHTWDLARATGLDETLDPSEVRGMLAGIEPLGDVLAQSGQYGSRVELPPGAGEQSRLLAATGRRP